MSSNEALFGTSWSSGDPGDGDVWDIDGAGRTRAAQIATERSQTLVASNGARLAKGDASAADRQCRV
jgi:hypothetical protein